jgi:AcrR family transcriptional regulator
MTGSGAAPEPRDRSTRDALMDAAVDLLEERGVLAGLNLREVADRVGVTPANIYHLFGSRQGLLRAALQRETDLLTEAVIEAGPLPYVERRLRMFDAVTGQPRLALTALLALDGDTDYEPFPFLDSTLARYEDQVERGELPAGLDIEAAHVVALATSIAVAIYGAAAARQLDVDADALRARLRVVFATMLESLVADPGVASPPPD